MTDWQPNFPLAPRTTLQVGGAAQWWCEAPDRSAVIDALSLAEERALPVTVLGGGSNVLIADEGLRGLVLHASENRVEIDGERVRATAGVEWDSLVERCVSEDLAGLECLSGIPGCVGAAPIQNIGAYGRELGDVLEAVEVVDRRTRASVTLSAHECHLGYRTSAFKTSWRDRYVVTAVRLRLRKGGRPELGYRELIEQMPDRTPGIREVRARVLEIRRSKSMVWDPSDPNHRSAGSFFVNPIVAPAVVDRVEELTGAAVPRYPTASRDVKVPAAWLIERAGFHKGFRRGRAGISTAHALALINCGEASASELVELARAIQTRVRQHFAIELQPEPVWLGF